MRGAALGLALLAGAGCAHGPVRTGAAAKGEAVEVEGWAPLDPKDRPGSFERALADAQRRAVEQVAGVSVSGGTLVKDALSVRSRVETSLEGAIDRFVILSEKGEGDFLKVRIRAFVLRASTPAVRRGSRGRFFQASAERALAEGIAQGLEESGFAAAGSEAEADIVVRGVAQAFAVGDPRLAGLSAYRASASLEARKAAGGAVSLSSEEASAVDPVDAIAREKALAAAGRMAGRALAARISR